MSSINEQRSAVARMRDEFVAAQQRRQNQMRPPPHAPTHEEVCDTDALPETEFPEAAELERPH